MPFTWGLLLEFPFCNLSSRILLFAQQSDMKWRGGFLRTHCKAIGGGRWPLGIIERVVVYAPAIGEIPSHSNDTFCRVWDTYSPSSQWPLITLRHPLVSWVVNECRMCVWQSPVINTILIDILWVACYRPSTTHHCRGTIKHKKEFSHELGILNVFV